MLTHLCRLDERLELDYQIGEDLKDRIIPHSILYFTGEATAYEMDDDDFEDEFDEDDEDGFQAPRLDVEGRRDSMRATKRKTVFMNLAPAG